MTGIINAEKNSEHKSSNAFTPSQTLNLIELIRNEVRFDQKSLSTRFLEWGTLCVALLGLLLGVYNYYASLEAKKHDNAKRLDDQIQQVFDILGGVENDPHLPSDLRVRDQRILQRAKIILDDLIRRDPKNARVHLIFAIWWASKGRHDRETEYIQKAIQLDPEYTPALMYLGIMYAGQSKHNEAIVEYEKAINLNPDMAEIHFNLGNALYQIKKYDEAYIAYERANKLDSDIPKVHVGLGDILFLHGKYDEAIGEYEEAIKLYPGYALAKQKLKNTQSAKRMMLYNSKGSP